MTIEEKLDYFMKVSVNDSYEKSQIMFNEYKAGIDKAFEHHKAEALVLAETYMRTEKTAMKRNLYKDFSKQQNDIRRQLTNKQEELKERLFSEVVEALEKYKKTDDYNKLLVKYIKDSLHIAGDNEIEIFIDPKDSDKLEYLTKETGVQIKADKQSFMGGMKAIIPSKNIIIDNSFESKLELKKENFVISL
ncbi:MAG: V-type ATP synthase subunit E [Lachnospiraceae bacterium]|nr:V-type ATP synthase subunit E [Lachnospiraceae bacterium]